MKKIPLLFNLLFLLFFSCVNDNIEKEKPEEQLEPRHAFVIGFDQCARRRGKILAIVNPVDTVITYNFPDSLYVFPDDLFSNYQFDCLFPTEELNSYPVTIKYRNSRQDELGGFVCLDIYAKPLFSKVVNNHQVVVTWATAGHQ